MEEKIRRFLQISYGFGKGNGSGGGSDDGYGSGGENWCGGGCVSGCGYGGGCDSGCGCSNGFGYGYGEGACNGIVEYNKNRVYLIDGAQIIIKSVKDNIAKGFVVNTDLTLTPCFIVKVGSFFAHGKTLRKAMSKVVEKHI